MVEWSQNQNKLILLVLKRFHFMCVYWWFCLNFSYLINMWAKYQLIELELIYETNRNENTYDNCSLLELQITKNKPEKSVYSIWIYIIMLATMISFYVLGIYWNTYRKMSKRKLITHFEWQWSRKNGKET